MKRMALLLFFPDPNRLKRFLDLPAFFFDQKINNIPFSSPWRK